MTSGKKIPKWVEEREAANKPKEEVIFIGELGVAGVIDGKLPNGEPYLWKKRRK